MQLALNEITVIDRDREDYGDIPELAASLTRVGQLQPIIVDQNNRLVAGGRRLAAAAMLKWKTIWAEYKKDLSEVQLKLMELEENLQRKDLSWPEQCKSVKKIHSIKMATDPEWSVDKTANFIGYSRRRVYDMMELSEAMDKFEDIGKANTITGGMQRLERAKELEKRRESAKVAELAEKFDMAPRSKAEVVHGDAYKEMTLLADASLDLVMFNPPFGVDIENLFTTDKTIYSNDGEDEVVSLCDRVIGEAFRVLKDNRWMVIFWPTRRLDELIGVSKSIRDALRSVGVDMSHPVVKAALGGLLAKHGFKFQAVPSVWYKPNKRVSSMGDPYRQVNIDYETFIFARKGKAVFHKLPNGTTYTYDTVLTKERIHSLEMPVPLWMDILESVSLQDEYVLEPFSGSGSGGEASLYLNRNWCGIEASKQYVDDARARLTHASLNRKPPKVETTLDIAQATDKVAELKSALSRLVGDGLNKHGVVMEETNG